MSKPAGTRVIGVVGDTVTSFMRPQSAIVYMPFDQTIFGPLLVRSANPSAVSAPVQDALLGLNPLARPRVTLVADGLRDHLRLPRALVTLALLLGLTALGLAIVGLFGVTAFVVDQRRHEVSVRMALGATTRGVTRMLMRDSLRPVVAGAVLGLVAAPLVARLIRFVLFGVSPYDPWAFAGASVLLGVAAAGAVFFPARRASRVDPVAVLKSE
jgi:predicted lysophospholipase L1 biosynthesis ABC-type transport system permease subunit